MSEDQIELLIKRTVKETVAEVHRTCPSFHKDHIDVLKTFAKGSTPESVQSLAAFGKRLRSVSEKFVNLFLWTIVGIVVWVLGRGVFSNIGELFRGAKP